MSRRACHGRRGEGEGNGEVGAPLVLLSLYDALLEHAVCGPFEGWNGLSSGTTYARGRCLSTTHTRIHHEVACEHGGSGDVWASVYM
jgi:hypothetical protein